MIWDAINSLDPFPLQHIPPRLSLSTLCEYQLDKPNQSNKESSEWLRPPRPAALGDAAGAHTLPSWLRSRHTHTRTRPRWRLLHAPYDRCTLDSPHASGFTPPTCIPDHGGRPPGPRTRLWHSFTRYLTREQVKHSTLSIIRCDVHSEGSILHFRAYKQSSRCIFYTFPS